MPYLTVPPPTRRRDRPLAHPELALAPGWVLLGMLGVQDAITDPYGPVVTIVGVATALMVSAGGLLLVLSALWDTDRLSTIWQIERAGWVVGMTGWAAYVVGVGYRSQLVIILAVTYLTVGALRLVALRRIEDHIRDVKRRRNGGGR